MKKIITTILSVLLITTCFTINTFAENEEGQLTYSSTEETMEIVIPEKNNARVSMIKYNAGDDNDPSYEWKINPNDAFFEYEDYTIFCKDVAIKKINYTIVYNGTNYSSENLNITISGPVNNIITARTTVDNNNNNININISYYDKVFYVREVYYDNNNNLAYDNRAITADKRVSVLLKENKSYALYYGDDYNKESSDTEEMISINNYSDLRIEGNSGFITLDNNRRLLNLNANSVNLSATITYEGQTISFVSGFPYVGLYTSSVISEATYCSEYGKTTKDFYINWLDDEINGVSISSINNFDNYQYNNDENVNEYISSMVEGKKSLKITFDDGVDITKGLDIKVNLSYTDGRKYSIYINPANYNEKNQENTDSIIVNNNEHIKNVIEKDGKTINCYIHKDINSQKETIINSIDTTNILNDSNILISYNEVEYNEINRDKIFFDHGVYFLLEKEISLEAYSINDIATIDLASAQKINLNPFELDLLFKNTDLEYSQNNTYLFNNVGTGYVNSFTEVMDGNYTDNNQYFWYSDNPNVESRIKIKSNFDNTIYFATRMANSYFDQINSAGDVFTKQNNVIATTLNALQNYIDQQFTIGGSIIKVDNDISFVKDLRITNYKDKSMNSVTSDNAEESVLIDLQGHTLNLGQNKIIVSESSTVHIKNGRIIGTGDALFENYGGLSLDGVIVNNNSKDQNSYAIKTYRGIVYVNGKSTIDAKNGIKFSDSYYKYSMSNSCKVSGRITATNNGIIFEKINAAGYNDFFSMLAPDNVDQDTLAPSIVAGNIAVKADNKVDMMVSGFEQNNNVYTANIKGATAIEVCSGKLDIGRNVRIESTDNDSPNIKINSQNVEKDLLININVSHNTNFVSKKNIIQEINDRSNREITLNIFYNQSVNNSLFSYGTSEDPFIFSGNSTIKNISGGYYSNGNIKNHITSDYKVVTENNLHKVVVDSTIPTDYIFNWNYNDNDINNINTLKSYIENLGTRNVRINSFKSDQNANSQFRIKEFKNISIEAGVIVNGIEFIVNAPSKEVHFNGGNVSNNERCIYLKSGKLYINNTINGTGSTNEAILVTGGTLQLEPSSSVSGRVALNIQANDTIPNVSVCGTLHGTSGIAMIYKANPYLSNDLNNYAVYLDNHDNRVKINGGINVENGKLVTMNTDINAAIGIELSGRSELVIDEETVINASDTGVYLNGSGTLFFSKGEIKASYPVKIKDNNQYNNYTVVFMDDTHCSTSGQNKNIINYINDDNEIVEKTERTKYKFFTEKALFNVEVNETQFSNLNMLQNQGNELEGMYKCVQFKALNDPNDPYAYTIGYKLESVKHNSLHLNFTNNDNIAVDSERLDYLLDGQNDDVWTLLVLEEAEISEKPEGALEAYDIQVRKINSDKQVELISETSNYQNIIIPVDKVDIHKIVVSHKHGQEKTINLPKLEKDEALKFTKECYYENTNSSIGIITKKFSIFGIIANSEAVLPVAPDVMNPTASSIKYKQKLGESELTDGWYWGTPNIVLDAGDHVCAVYKDVTDYNKYDYSGIEGYNSSTHRIVRNISIKVEKADPTYNIPSNLTATYGNKLSDVTLPNGWSWKESNTSVGNATSEGRKFKATFTPSDTANYNTIEKDLLVIINKANPSYTIPSNLTATYGDKLASIVLLDNTTGTPGTFTFVNPNNYVGNAGTQEAEIVFTPKDTENYNVINDRVNIVVKKATPVVSHPSIKATYGDKFGAIKLENRFSFKDKNANDLVGDAGDHNVTLTYTPEDANNYNSVDVNVKLTVEKAYPKTVDVPSIDAVDKRTKLSSIKLNDDRFKWKNSDAEVSDTNIAYYTASSNYKTIEVNIPIPVNKTMTIGDIDINVVSTSSVSNNSATNVTISNDALSLNSQKIVNRITEGNLGDIKIADNSVKDIVEQVKGDPTSLTLVVQTTLNKQEKALSELSSDDKNKIETALSGDKVLSCLDLKVNLTVSSKDGGGNISSKSTNISELEDSLQIEVDVETDKLPVAPENKKIEYYVIPLHNGETLDPISAKLINGKLVFMAKKFSYYTVSYKFVDNDSSNQNSTTPSKPSNLRPVVNTSSH